MEHHAADAAQSTCRPADGLSEAAARAAFETVSHATHAHFDLSRIAAVPEHVLREDVVQVLERALNRQLNTREVAAAQLCFALDGGPLMSWSDFRAGLPRFRAILAPPAASTAGAGHRSLAKLQAAKRRGRVFHGASNIGQQTLTSSQEVGLAHRLMPALAPPRHGIRATEVTAGGEGRSLQHYYGMYL